MRLKGCHCYPCLWPVLLCSGKRIQSRIQEGVCQEKRSWTTCLHHHNIRLCSKYQLKIRAQCTQVSLHSRDSLRKLPDLILLGPFGRELLADDVLDERCQLRALCPWRSLGPPRVPAQEQEALRRVRIKDLSSTQKSGTQQRFPPAAHRSKRRRLGSYAGSELTKQRLAKPCWSVYLRTMLATARRCTDDSSARRQPGEDRRQLLLGELVVSRRQGYVHGHSACAPKRTKLSAQERLLLDRDDTATHLHQGINP